MELWKFDLFLIMYKEKANSNTQKAPERVFSNLYQIFLCCITGKN